MAQEPEFPFRRPATLLLLWLLVLGSGLVLVATVRDAIDELRGGTVDAVVVDITTDGPGRRVYDVRLETRSGLVCVTRVDSGSNPPPRTITAGGLSRVRYPGSRPCAAYAVEESTATPAWQAAVFAALVVGVVLVVLRRMRHRR
jgi:hypothetical protein